MGKRFLILIGAAALGAMALGAQMATSFTGERVDTAPPNLQLSGPKTQDPQNDPLRHSCDNGYCDVVVKARCGHQTCTARSWGKLTNVRNDNLKSGGSSNEVLPGRFKGMGHELTLSQCRQVRRALKRGEKVKAKVTVRARDAAGNVATVKRTIRLVKNTPG
jgi:hypothetical protein